jgi:hypothetical protein
MCTPSPDELVTIREFLACKDPRDATRTHTFSYLIDDENHKIAEEILDTSISSPWEMIRSLTQEERPACVDQLDTRFNLANQVTEKTQGPLPESTARRRAATLKPRSVFVPRLTDEPLMLGSRLKDEPTQQRRAALPEVSTKLSETRPTEMSSRSDLSEAQFIRRLTCMARKQIENAIVEKHSSQSDVESVQERKEQLPRVQHVVMERTATRVRKGTTAAQRSSTSFPILDDSAPTSYHEQQGGVNSASPVGIQLLKVFENDEYITFRKVYPAAIRGGKLASVRDQGAASKRSNDAEARDQWEAGRASHRRETRADPPGSVEMEEHTDVISEETKLSSSGARQVLIVVSSKNKPSGMARKR